MENQTLESNKKIVRQFFEYFSKGDVTQIENLWGPDYKFHYPGRTNTLGKKESQDLIRQYHSAFPDMKFTIEDQIAEGEMVVTRISVSGTHKGDFMGIVPSNKKISATGIASHKIQNNKIVEEWTEFDMLGIMKQIGAVPEMAATGKNNK